MADERIDIQITDKIANSVETKLLAIADAATQGDKAVSALRANLAALSKNSTAQVSQSVNQTTTAINQNTAAQQKNTQAATQNVQTQQKQNTQTKQNTQSQNQNASATKLTAAQLANLNFQLQDVIVSLASGQKPLTVLIQQGSQIQGIFGPGTGVLGVLKGVGRGIAQIVGPTTAIVASVAAGVALLGKAWNDYTTDIGEATAVTQGIGRYLNLTADQFVAISRASAEAGKITVGESLALGASLARTGNVGIDSIKKLQATVKDFAATIGTDVEQASKTLVNSFKDVQGIETLNKQLAFLDANTLRTVQSLAAQGKEQDAIKLAVDKYESSLVKAKDTTSALGSLTNGVLAAMSRSWSDLGKSIDAALGGGTVEERINRLSTAIVEMEIQLAARQNVRQGFRSGAALADLERKANDAKAALAALQAQQAKDNADRKEKAANDDLNRRSQSIRQLATEAAPASETIRKLTDNLTLLKQAENNPELQKRIGDQKSLTEATDAYSRALQSLRDIGEDKATRDAKIADIDLKLINETNAGRRAQLQMERERISLAGQVITTAEAEQRIRQAGLTVTTEASKARRLENEEMAQRLKLSGLVGPAFEIESQLQERVNAAKQSGNAYSAAEIANLRQKLTLQQQANAVQQAANTIYQQSVQPATDYNNTLTAANQLLKDGTISQTQYNIAVTDAAIRMNDASQTMKGGFLSGILTVQNELNKTGDIIKGGVTTAFRGLEDGLVNLFTTGKFGFEEFSKMLQAEATRIIVKLFIMRALMQSLSSVFGGGFNLSNSGGSQATLAPPMNILPGAASGMDGIIGGVSGTDRNLLPVSKGERAIIQTPEQQRRAEGGKQVVNVYPPPGHEVTQNQRQGANGDDLIDIVINAVKSDYANGGFDNANAGRYGVSTLTRRVG